MGLHLPPGQPQDVCLADPYLDGGCWYADDLVHQGGTQVAALGLEACIYWLATCNTTMQMTTVVIKLQ